MNRLGSLVIFLNFRTRLNSYERANNFLSSLPLWCVNTLSIFIYTYTTHLHLVVRAPERLIDMLYSSGRFQSIPEIEHSNVQIPILLVVIVLYFKYCEIKVPILCKKTSVNKVCAIGYH